MDAYSPIADHGLIGDLQTAALVTTDGVLDWFCCPRFDSPSVFASLLDADRGGFFRIAPDRDDYVTRQLYLPDTAILITRFMTPDGVGEVHDFMPVITGAATDRHRLVRSIRVVRGEMRFAIEIQPLLNILHSFIRLFYLSSLVILGDKRFMKIINGVILQAIIRFGDNIGESNFSGSAFTIGIKR